MTEQEQKLLFAKRYRDDKSDPLMIVQDVMPKGSDPIAIINAMRIWPYDPIVLAEMKRLDEIPVEKTQINHELLIIARSSFHDAKDRIAAYKLVAELNGLIVPSALKAGAKSTDKLAELQQMLEDDDAKDNPNG